MFNRKYIYLLFALGFFLLISSTSYGQEKRFDEALNLYQQQEYRKAAEIFSSIESEKAKLFAGKSYFGLGEYLTAQSYLARIDTLAEQEIVAEAAYTSALTEFQLKNFSNALAILFQLSDENDSATGRRAESFYRDILNYLTVNQKKETFQQLANSQIRIDLIESAFGNVDYHTAEILLAQLKKAIPGNSFRNELAKMEQMLADSVNYRIQQTFGENTLKAPEGITYNIGVALPEYEPADGNFGISQGLYFGYLMAAEDFNTKNSSKKVALRFKNTASDPDSIAHIMADLTWNLQADGILGPLFSEPAGIMAGLAEQYQIPMLAPLANSDSLNLDNPYVYQANPTFTSHGKKMAQFAVNNLNMDTLAVLAESGSLGSASAYAFREEAERLGAKVAYFFVESLESQGYEITDYTKHFTTDSTVIDSLGYHYLDGIYAPFTGQVAPTLIDLLLIDLQGLKSDLPVLGSQEWGATAIRDDRLDNRSVYFTESFYINTKSDKTEEFTERFNNRFGTEPNRFAMIGYDAATFLLTVLDRTENPALLKNAMKNQPLYEGLISNIHFDGTHINQEVKVFKLTKEGIYPADSDQ